MSTEVYITTIVLTLVCTGISALIQTPSDM